MKKEVSIKTKDKAKKVFELACSKKANDVVILELIGLNFITDYFVICSGSSDVQVKAIADAIIEGLKKEGEICRQREGYEHAHWILLDYQDIIVHIFHEEARQFYQLEELWADAKQLEFQVIT